MSTVSPSVPWISHPSPASKDALEDSGRPSAETRSKQESARASNAEYSSEGVELETREAYGAASRQPIQDRAGRCLPRPASLILPPPPVKSPRKRTATELEEEDQEESVQAEAGYNRESFGDLSGVEFCVCQPSSSAQKIPRPPNCFILYRQHTSPFIAQQNPGLSVPQVSKLAGKAWSSLSEREKKPWQIFAESEKLKHHQEHPNYRYQPRKNGRRNSTAETPTAISPKHCNKCGKLSMVNPTTPSSAESYRPNFPTTPQSASFNFNSRQLPPMSNPPLTSPHRHGGTRQHPANIHIPPITQMTNYQVSDREHPVTPDAKRRRIANGPPAPMHSQNNQNAPHNAASPYRGSFSHPHATQQWASQGRAMMLPQHGQGQSLSTPHQQQLVQTAVAQAPRHDSLTLPKDLQSGRTLEEIFKEGSVMEQLKVLGRVSQPLQDPKPTEVSYAVRGAAVAVEGDNPQAVFHVVQYLESHLTRSGSFLVKVAEGPEAPKEGREAKYLDFLDLVSIWLKKKEEMEQFMTRIPLQGQEKDEGELRGTLFSSESLLPVILLNRYSHFATTAWASRITPTGKYEAKDHWLWFASLWRDMIGPDVTIYVRDSSTEEIAKHKAVELVENLRVILVRKGKGVGEGQWKVDDRTLRRLGFEVTEWIRSVSSGGGN